MPVKISLKCKICGFEIDARGSEDPIPSSCPSCGSREMEFSAILLASGEGAEEDRQAPMIDDSFIRQVSPGEYVVDLLSAQREVAIAELEPGVYEIVIRRPSSPFVGRKGLE